MSLEHLNDLMTGMASPTNSIAVRKASTADAASWNDTLSFVPNGSFYLLFEWKDIFEKEFGHRTSYWIAEHGGQMVGLLPVVHIRSHLFGRIDCSVPFLNYGGIVSNSKTVDTALLSAALREAESDTANLLEIRSPRPLLTDREPSLHKVSMTVALDSDPDVLWKGFTSKHRTAIRRAFKNDLQVESGGEELLDEFYCVMSEAWRDLGTPFYRKRFFRRILQTLPANARIYVCRQGRAAVSVALNGSYRDIEEGLWTGSLGRARALQPSYVLYWEMIKDACERGMKIFHLGRSTVDSGGEHFKRKWNAEETQLFWYQYSPAGDPLDPLTVENSKFRLAIAAWRRLPIAITARLGPLLSRSIP
jgi:FemAB-related protein (PEP-CTERM system-associated)